jgi:hypothetical protein
VTVLYRIVLSFSLLLFSSRAMADGAGINFEAGPKEPIIDWSNETIMNGIEGTQRHCGLFAAEHENKIKCAYDRESFEKFYRIQQKKKAKDRPESNPAYDCSTAFQYLFCATCAQQTADTLYLKNVLADFLSRVKTVTCQMDTNKKTSPGVKLVGDNLIIKVRTDADGFDGSSAAHGEGWLVKGMSEAFPVFKKAYADHH